MWARVSIVAGLVIGVAVAGLLLGGILAFVPERPLPSTPATSVPSATASPSPIASASPSASARPSGSVASAPFHIGEPAPALLLPGVGGGTIDLAALRGKPVWVNFMATWCPPCQDEIPLMTGFAERYASTGLTVLAIDVREDEAAVQAFAGGLGATFPFGLDADGAAARTWDAIALPVHFWIDKDGIIRDAALGGIGPDVMVDGLKTILPGVDVQP